MGQCTLLYTTGNGSTLPSLDSAKGNTLFMLVLSHYNGNIIMAWEATPMPNVIHSIAALSYAEMGLKTKN